jgi:hypothetical protein
VRRRTSGVVRSSKVTISVREGLLILIFCVMRVRIVISVVGGGSDGKCGCTSTSVVGVKGGWAVPGVAVACSRVLLNHIGRVTCVGVGRGTSREGCMWQTFPAMRGWRGVVKWVLRGGWGVDTDPEVRFRSPSVVMEVVGLWRHSRVGDRPEREARRDERRPMVRQRGLLTSPLEFVALIFFLQGAGGVLENLCSRSDRDH